MRITRKMLQSRVDNLNRILNRPQACWTRIVKDGRTVPQANPGHFLLDSYSPGDGWTRYRLNMICTDGGGETEVSPCCNAQEMWTYLRGVFDVLDSVHMADCGRHTFTKYPHPAAEKETR